jgi:hypothetical protein
MTIGTTAAAEMQLPSGWRSDIKGAAVAMLVAGFTLGRRKRLSKLLVALAALGMATGLSACGSGPAASSTGTATGSPSGQTLFTIDTSGSNGVTTVTHDSQYQVTLQ